MISLAKMLSKARMPIIIDVDLTASLDNPLFSFEGETIKWKWSFDSLSDYPWIRDLDHLKRVNKYRKRCGQLQIRLNDDDIAELALLTER